MKLRLPLVLLQNFRFPLKDRIFVTARQLESEKRRLIEKITKHVDIFYGSSMIDDAWKLFRVWMETEFNPKAEDRSLFLAWYTFRWDLISRNVLPRGQTQKTASDLYLETFGERMTVYEKKICQQARESQPTFYRNLGIRDEIYVQLQSMQSMEIIEVPYVRFFQNIPQGDCVCAMIAKIQGVSLVLGMSPKIPRKREQTINQFYETFDNRNFTEDFHELASDFFSVYHDATEKTR